MRFARVFSSVKEEKVSLNSAVDEVDEVDVDVAFVVDAVLVGLVDLVIESRHEST